MKLKQIMKSLPVIILGIIIVSFIIEIFGFNYSYFANSERDITYESVSYENLSVKDGVVSQTGEENGVVRIEGIDHYVGKLTFKTEDIDGARFWVKTDRGELSETFYFSAQQKTINIKEKTTSISIITDLKEDMEVYIGDFELSNNFRINWIRYSMMVIAFLALVLFFYYLRSKKCIFRPEIAALVIILLVGGIVAYFTPLCHNWDERSHLIRSYNVAKGNLLYQHGDTIDYIEDVMASNNTWYKWGNNYSYEDTIQAKSLLKQFKARDTKPYVINSEQVVYTAVPYIPSGIGILIASIFNLSFFHIMWFGRMGNVIMYALLCYYAIKISPVSKRLLFVLSVLPINLFLAASFSCDIMIIGFTLLSLAYILNLNNKQGIMTWKEAGLVLLFLSMITLAKSTYAPLFLMVLLLKKEKFSGKKQQIIYISVSFFTAGFLFIALFLYGNKMGLSQWAIPGLDAKGQIRYILTNPLRYISVLWKFVQVELLQRVTYTFSNFAYIGRTGDVGLILSLLLMVITAFTDNSGKLDSVRKDRLILTATSIIAFVVSATALYVTFTPYQSGGIDGFQGRYLIPLIVLLLMAFRNDKITNKISDKTYYSYSYLILFYCQFELIFRIISKYYS